MKESVKERVLALRSQALEAGNQCLQRIADNPASCWSAEDMGVCVEFWPDCWRWRVVAYDVDGGQVSMGFIEIPSHVWND